MTLNRKLAPLLDREFENDSYIGSIIESTIVARNRQMSRYNGSDWLGN
jgi:hypothetical protein